MKETKEVKDTNQRAFEKILYNYDHMNRMIVEELEIATEHSTLTGDYREQTWLDLFRRIIPKKYSLAQGVMIIDSFEGISKEVDIAVYDEQYTPYIFQYNTLKFIPIEAVAVVIECKSTGWEEEKLKSWSEAIDSLVPKSSGIARMFNGYVCGITNEVQKRTRPIKILAAIKTYAKEGTAENIKNKFKENFDFIIMEKEEKDSGDKKESKNKTLEILINNAEESLGWWGKELNSVDEDKNDKDKLLKLERLSVYPKKSGEQNTSEQNTGEQNTSKQNIEEKLSYTEEYPELNFEKNYYSQVTLENLKIKNNPLLSLNFQLNQLLMLLNNPMLFPHYAYAKRFNEIVESYENNNGKISKKTNEEE